ncbi:MAG: GPI anchored serine-threonine rich family protein [Caldiserica bacterium]|jgi:prepilin-type N-terminal cleavage/methylation domain-containing protein|nr:GPI anchored serine-threonine rich family protein [Caldisericota bacterium]
MGKRKILKGDQGFSIVELIIAMAIIAIVAVFIVILAAEMLVFTGKTHAKDIALQLADSKVEELRSTLNIPEYAEDEPKPGYIRTVTSTYLREGDTPTSPIIKYLRNVTVTVRTPTQMGAKTVTIVTNIQTYRPQISFILPVTAEAYGNAKDPVLEGTIRDDAFDILKSQVFYRLGNGSNWGSWTPVTNFFEDIDRNTSVTSPTLSWGITYYFTIPLSLSGDGTITEVQVQATNTASIANIQPPTPLGGSSFIRLISDNTDPVISPGNSPAYMPTTTDTTPGFKILVAVRDDHSGVFNCYLLLSRESGGTTQYWDETDPMVPKWSSSRFYSSMELDTTTPSIYRWPPTGTVTVPVITPTETFRVSIYALDQVIGKYYDYMKKIPTQGIAVPTGEKIWPEVAANFATFSATLPYVETMDAYSKNPAKVFLKGKCNTWSSTYNVYFQYWESNNPGQTFNTQKIPFSSSIPTEFSTEISFNPNTSYNFRAICETPWGTFWGGIKGISVIHLLIPNGGENWTVGETKEIRWESWGVSGNVNILLSRDGGGSWETIANNLPVADGSYSWTVSGQVTTSALIKVESETHPSIYDVSDNTFSINSP